MSTHGLPKVFDLWRMVSRTLSSTSGERAGREKEGEGRLKTEHPAILGEVTRNERGTVLEVHGIMVNRKRSVFTLV